MQVSSSSMFGSIFQTSQTSKTKAAGGMDMSWADAAPATDSSSTARSQFADYMKMTPAEKMRAAMLAQMGVTEEEYKAMSPEKKAEIDAKIQEKIKQQMEMDPSKKDSKGVFADMKV